MSDGDEWFDDFAEDSGDVSQGPPGSGSDSDALGSSGEAPLHGERSPTSGPQKSQLYTVVDRARLMAVQEEALGQVRTILGCDTTTARALLTHFGWDAESVLGTIAERGQDAVYRRAGVLSCAPDAAPVLRPGSRQRVACGVCMCDAAPSACEAMACGHAFCRDCWRQHLRLGVQEGLSRRLRCMAPGCGIMCDEDKARELLRDSPELVQKYEQALLESYVDDNKRVKWCPSVPHCGHAVRANGEPHCEVECACGQRFCFACAQVPHSPATCDMLRDWLERYQSGTETASWLRANTKPCPKCSKPVEKAGGCNLVLCRCGQAFCWLCGQGTGRAHSWTHIDGHSCGAYRELAESQASAAQRNLDRYLHYVTRYEAHLASLRFEERTRGQLEVKIDAMIEAESELSNYAWLQTALEQLFLSRRVLAYSYIFAYYMFGGAWFSGDLSPQRAAVNQALFEDKQGQLEVEVERLAKLVEATPAEAIPGMRLAIINLAATINTRILKMYEVIENDIAAQLAASSLHIAPYRGQRTPGGGDASRELYESAAAAAADAAAAAAAADAAGPSHSAQPADADVIDLTAEQSDGTPPDHKGKGKPRFGIKRLRKG